jgi:hypothetical protein
MIPPPWENEFRYFNSIVRTIIARAENGEISRDEINNLDSTLMQSHRKMSDMVFALQNDTLTTEHQRFIDNISDIYSAAHALLLQLRKSWHIQKRRRLPSPLRGEG